MTMTQDGWERYGGTLTRAMAEVLPEFPDEVLLTGWPGQPPSGLNSRLAHSEQTQPTPLGL